MAKTGLDKAIEQAEHRKAHLETLLVQYRGMRTSEIVLELRDKYLKQLEDTRKRIANLKRMRTLERKKSKENK